MGDTCIIIIVFESLTSFQSRHVFEKAECFDRSQNSPNIVFKKKLYSKTSNV